MKRNILLVGTNTPSCGIYSFVLSADMKKVISYSQQTDIHNPAYFTMSRNRKFLYALDDSPDHGSITAFSCEPNTGALAKINTLDLPEARGSCHLAVTADGRFAVVCHYYSNWIISCSIRTDGSIGEVVCKWKHESEEAYLNRHDPSHPHGVFLSPDNRYLFVCDLGIGQYVWKYDFDIKTGAFAPAANQPKISMESGDRPRHAAFHPTGEYMYVVTEPGNKIYVFSYDATEGTLQRLQVAYALPDDFSGHSICCEVLLTRDGRHLFASNRVYDGIVHFGVDEKTGLLLDRAFLPNYGGEPRHLMLSPSEEQAIICNDSSNTVAICAFMGSDKNQYRKQLELYVPNPACAAIFPTEQ